MMALQDLPFGSPTFGGFVNITLKGGTLMIIHQFLWCFYRGEVRAIGFSHGFSISRSGTRLNFPPGSLGAPSKDQVHNV